MGIGEGFGKTIFVGDAFVQFGIPAIVAAISQRTAASVYLESGSGWSVDDSRAEVPGYKESKKKQQEDSVERIFRAMKIDVTKHRIRISFGGDLLAGSGIGASAAGCVALARALSDEFNLELSDERINEIALEGERGYHGDPGGIDNTASTYGGLLWFEKDIQNCRDHIERIRPGAELHLVLGNSNVNVDTAKVVAYKKELVNTYPDKFKAVFEVLKEHAFALREAMELPDLVKIGKVMKEHHRILRQYNFSHKMVEKVVEVALENGALGAKVTGGGMGGYVLALAENEEDQMRMSHAMEERGFRTVITKVGIPDSRRS